MAIIEVNHVTKEFQLGALTTLKQTALNTLHRLAGSPPEQRPPFKALDDINLSIAEGEVVGIIGHNGAGKSTLLKLLANISKPTSGSIAVRGQVAPLIEVGAGLIGDLTGRENIYLNGAILGIPKRDITRKFDEIVAFAELEEFIDTPVKRYSSGMQVRLGFSIATSVESDILIVDEVLAVGDLAFQRKCFDRIEELIKRQGRTVLVVSHNIRQVERISKRVILLDHGRVVSDALPQLSCNKFYEQSDAKIQKQLSTQFKSETNNITSESSGELELLSISIHDASENSQDIIEYKSPVRIKITFRSSTTITAPTFGIGAHTPDMIFVATDDSIFSTAHSDLQFEAGIFEIQYLIDSFTLLPGSYALRLGVANKNTDRHLFYAENLSPFRVRSKTLNRSRTVHQGFVSFDGRWEMKAETKSQPLTL